MPLDLLRKYQKQLFYESDIPTHKRVYIFYAILKKLEVFKWFKKTLIKHGLEPQEAESEIYILAHKLFKGFDPQRGSIIPYIEKQIVWKMQHRLVKFNKQEVVDILDEPYHEENEFYLDDLLNTNIFLAKKLTRGQKFILYKLITEEKSQVDLANEIGVQRCTVINYLSDIREVLKGEYDEITGRR